MKNFLVFVAILFTVVIQPLPAFAGPLDRATEKLRIGIEPTGLQGDITVSVGTVVRGILAAAGTIFLVLTVYAGIIWMTAQGAAEKIEKAQSIVTTAVIGLVVTMSAYAITIFVTGRLNTGGAQTNYVAQCAALTNGQCREDEKLCVQGSQVKTLGGACPVCCYGN